LCQSVSCDLSFHFPLNFPFDIPSHFDFPFNFPSHFHSSFYFSRDHHRSCQHGPCYCPRQLHWSLYQYQSLHHWSLHFSCVNCNWCQCLVLALPDIIWMWYQSYFDSTYQHSACEYNAREYRTCKYNAREYRTRKYSACKYRTCEYSACEYRTREHWTYGSYIDFSHWNNHCAHFNYPSPAFQPLHSSYFRLINIYINIHCHRRPTRHT
jgi:hypothetical protein